MKPATQNGLGISLNLIAGLLTNTKLGKATFNLSDNPKLSALFISRSQLFLINLFQLNDPPF